MLACVCLRSAEKALAQALARKPWRFAQTRRRKPVSIARGMLWRLGQGPRGQCMKQPLCAQRDNGEREGGQVLKAAAESSINEKPPLILLSFLLFRLRSTLMSKYHSLSRTPFPSLTPHLNTEMPTSKIDPTAQACFDEVVAALGMGEGVKAKAREVRLAKGGEGGRSRGDSRSS